MTLFLNKYSAFTSWIIALRFVVLAVFLVSGQEYTGKINRTSDWTANVFFTLDFIRSVFLSCPELVWQVTTLSRTHSIVVSLVRMASLLPIITLIWTCARSMNWLLLIHEYQISICINYKDDNWKIWFSLTRFNLIKFKKKNFSMSPISWPLRISQHSKNSFTSYNHFFFYSHLTQKRPFSFIHQKRNNQMIFQCFFDRYHIIHDLKLSSQHSELYFYSYFNLFHNAISSYFSIALMYTKSLSNSKDHLHISFQVGSVLKWFHFDFDLIAFYFWGDFSSEFLAWWTICYVGDACAF